MIDLSIINISIFALAVLFSLMKWKGKWRILPIVSVSIIGAGYLVSQEAGGVYLVISIQVSIALLLLSYIAYYIRKTEKQ